MKRTGRHREKELTAVGVRQITTPGRYPDGNGLYLQVDKSGAKRWILRTVVQGRRRDIGLGGLSLVSLAEAREKATAYRKLAREGGDPIAEKRRTARTVPTFAAAATVVHQEHKTTWKNAKHAQQWINTLEQYANPIIGQKPVNEIETPDILKVLAPIWLTKPETARRLRQRMGTVFDWAKASGHRSGDNPVEGVAKGLPKQTDRDVHHAALPYSAVPAFVAQLRDTTGDGEVTRLGLEFLILTAARTGEVVGARWSEIDSDAKLWIIPAKRMKAGREHRVPLSKRVLKILERAKELSGGRDFVFSRAKGKPLSNMAFLMTLRRTKTPATAHGFRSSFRDWASEATAFPSELAEMALAHTIKNKVEAAYRRGDLLVKRAKMMEAWAEFVSAPMT